MTAQELAELIESKLSGEYPWTSGSDKDRYLLARADGDLVRVSVHDGDNPRFERQRFAVLVSPRGPRVVRLEPPAEDFSQAA